jgi:Leucine-rich repeat (LRR) protein
MGATMKRHVMHRATAVALVAVCTVLVTGCPLVGNMVYFKDSALESAVRASIFKPLGPLTEADMLLVTNLDARGLGIRNLSGLEYCLNLTRLDLDTNEISDITPLTNLVKLKVLVLDSNQIFDISPLAGLRELDMLSLFDNQVADIQALITNAGNGGLSEGDVLVLDVRHLGEEALQVQVPVLQNTYGVNVYLVTEDS